MGDIKIIMFKRVATVVFLFSFVFLGVAKAESIFSTVRISGENKNKAFSSGKDAIAVSGVVNIIDVSRTSGVGSNQSKSTDISVDVSGVVKSNSRAVGREVNCAAAVCVIKR